MNKVYTYTAFLLMFFLFSKCSVDDLFDIKRSSSVTTPTTLEDLQALLDNARTFNTFSPMLGENASDYHYFRESVSSFIGNNELVSYTWTKGVPFTIVDDWNNVGGNSSYGRIYVCNLILEALDKIDRSINPVMFDEVKGQALFQRGRTYFELSQIFVPPLSSNSTNLKLGLPLRVESDILAKSERSTIGATYDHIISDLMQASMLLPNLPLYKTRASKCAAYGMLARTYLAIEKYNVAKDFVDKAMIISNKLLNYADITVSGNQNPFVGYVDEVVFYSQAYKGLVFSFREACIDSVFYRSFDENDLRKKLYFRVDTRTGIPFYRGSYSGRGFDLMFTGIATDELYLISAECNARAGKVAEAMNDLNTLLKTRWSGEYVNLTAANADEALRIVLRERKKELIFRGVRWSDLRRLNKDPRFAQTFTRTFNGKTYTLEPNSNKYTLPLPDDVVQISGMEQNPGW